MAARQQRETAARPGTPAGAAAAGKPAPGEPASGGPGREADRARLTKEVVVDRALALGDSLGPEALTIRRLARELGVTPMAIYWHFRGKEELLAAVADRVWAEIDIDIDPSASWSAQLRGLLESLIQVLRAHPSASQLLLTGEKMQHGTASLLAIETSLEVLRRGGLDTSCAAAVARSALWTGLMLAMSEPGYDPALTPADRAETQRQARIRLAMLPPDRFPRLVAAADAMTSCDNPEFHYRLGIDLFIAGVVAIAERRSAPS